MKRKIKWIFLAVIALVSVGAYSVVLLKPALIRAETLQKGNLESRFTVQATVEPVSSMVLNSFTQGNVQEILQKAGSSALEGDVLIRTGAASETALDIQKEQYRQQLSAARQDYERLYGTNGAAASEMEAARVQYSLAQKNYDNGTVLAGGGGVISQSELDVLKSERDLAYQKYVQAKENSSEARKSYYQEQITSLEKQLAMLENAVSSGEVQMPYDGVLWEIYVEEGGYVAANQPVARIYRPGEMKLTASVLSEDAVLLEPGMKAEAVYADGTVSEAEISFVSSTAVQEISSIGLEENRCSVELVPKDLPKAAGAGQTADVSFVLVKAENVLHVPASAIVPDGEDSLVYVISGGKASPVSVETGRRESGRVEILSGLEEGSIIAGDPYNDHIKSGSRVKAQSEE